MNILSLLFLAGFGFSVITQAHELHWPASHPGGKTLENTATNKVPKTARAFALFDAEIGLSWDDEHVYIEGDGLPAHPMMSGITAWQQQVPLPHNFTGAQAFKIPLQPVYKETPGALTLIGPIALAVNGIPIFNALTQSGKDAYASGELDRWGGHCGRADDYHYHIAPAHLEAKVGKGNPVAFALDGYPIHVVDPAIDKPLDECHGYMNDQGQYRYVGTLKPPYVMAKFRGEADLDDRPRTQSLRPHLPPLRGAVVTNFTGTPATGAVLRFQLRGTSNSIAYQVDDTGNQVEMTFTDGRGQTRTETYTRNDRKGRKPPRDEAGQRRPPRGGEARPPRQGGPKKPR